MKQLLTKRKKILISVLLWFASILSSIIAKKIITYFNLDSHDPLTVLFTWLSLGIIIFMFFSQLSTFLKKKWESCMSFLQLF